jgi:quercetin dioxygenase-like cupin family protein
MGVNRWDDPKRIDEVEGGTRRVLGVTDGMMLVHYTLPEGAVGEPHSHEETTQASFVIEGSLELTGEFTKTVEAGDSYIIPPKTEHGVRVTEDCKVIDAFSPPLAKYR